MFERDVLRARQVCNARTTEGLHVLIVAHVPPQYSHLLEQRYDSQRGENSGPQQDRRTWKTSLQNEGASSERGRNCCLG